jgi:mono/diheme cytochrome c family protein
MILLPIIAVMIALRFMRLNILGWLLAWWIAIYLALSYGFDPPFPSSIIGMFMVIITLVLLVYLTANSENLEYAKSAVIALIFEKKYSLHLSILIVAFPVLVALKIYTDSLTQIHPPVVGRTIHPAPPPEIFFKGKKIDLVNAVNPYRELDESDPISFQSHLKNGRRVYYQNCVFCHGANLEGNGIFSPGLDPIPANFADPATIAMLQESYLFWRISKGGQGLPAEAAPWASAMPAWENFLNEEEIWDVILFLYDYTGQRPRMPEGVE